MPAITASTLRAPPPTSFCPAPVEAKNKPLTQAGITVCIGNGGKDDDQLVPGYRHRAHSNTGQGNIKSTRCCYMSAKPGERFCVHVAYDHRCRRGSRIKSSGFRVHVFVDGVYITDEFWPAEKLDNGHPELGIVGYRGAKDSAKNNSSTHGEQQLEEDWLGTILVQVHWHNYQYIIEDEDELDEFFVEELLDQALSTEVLGNPLHELKQGAKFDVGVEYAPDSAEPIDEAPEPIYHFSEAAEEGLGFIFRYRRPDWLVAEKIAPRSLLEPRDDQAQSTPAPPVKREQVEHEPEGEYMNGSIIKPTSPPRTRSSTRTEIKRETSSLARGTRSPSQHQRPETQSPVAERRASKRLASREQSTARSAKRVKVE
ncbi:hypothetical protein FRC12_003402 [Ceratobasidium sp. 428]|nr:hypothetical protein FRC12_003402 [Ceratobasidium sp. 428]